jgi:hypothetical protein
MTCIAISPRRDTHEHTEHRPHGVEAAPAERRVESDQRGDRREERGTVLSQV